MREEEPKPEEVVINLEETGRRKDMNLKEKTVTKEKETESSEVIEGLVQTDTTEKKNLTDLSEYQSKCINYLFWPINIF